MAAEISKMLFNYYDAALTFSIYLGSMREVVAFCTKKKNYKIIPKNNIIRSYETYILNNNNNGCEEHTSLYVPDTNAKILFVQVNLGSVEKFDSTHTHTHTLFSTEPKKFGHLFLKMVPRMFGLSGKKVECLL
jgi:hypothetical protein